MKKLFAKILRAKVIEYNPANLSITKGLSFLTPKKVILELV